MLAASPLWTKSLSKLQGNIVLTGIIFGKNILRQPKGSAPYRYVAGYSSLGKNDSEPSRDEEEKGGILAGSSLIAKNIGHFVSSYYEYHHSLLHSEVRAVPENLTKLDDVKGVDETKGKLKEVVEFLRNPNGEGHAEGSTKIKGVLLVGEPGTGKRLMSRAVAGEAQVPLFSLSGTELGSIPSLAKGRVVKVFETAIENSPCVIFIDHLDLILCKQTLLTQIDRIPEKKSVVVIVSTTPAGRNAIGADFLRPGRCNMEVHISPPDLSGRQEIIQKCLKRIKCRKDIHAGEIAERTLDFTGGVLETMLNEAVLIAVSEGHEWLRKKDLEFCLKLVEDCRKNFRESGALNEGDELNQEGFFAKDAPRIQKVSIAPKHFGEGLGCVSYLPVQGNLTAELLENQTQIQEGGAMLDKGITGRNFTLGSVLTSHFRFVSSFQARVVPEHVKDTFDDVKGVDEILPMLKEFAAILQNPERFTNLGAKLPKGLLLVGPPGVGKRLRARAVAGEAQVPYFCLNGRELQGVSERFAVLRIKNVFGAAKANAPCVLFIDQIGSFGCKRELLAGIDGILDTVGVIIIASTDPWRREVLDEEFVSPDRLCREVNVFAPDLKGQKSLVEKFLGKINFRSDVDAEEIAQSTLGLTGGYLKEMINEAASVATSEGVGSIGKKHLNLVRNKVFRELNRNIFQTSRDANKLRRAYLMAGHALVTVLTKDAPKLDKVTIVPRHGESFDPTSFLASTAGTMTSAERLACMDAELGGIAAESLIFSEDETTDELPQNFQDEPNPEVILLALKEASDKLGLRSFSKALSSPTAYIDLSPRRKKVLDSEVKRLLLESFSRATKIIIQHPNEYKALVDALLKYETLGAESVKKIIRESCNHVKSGVSHDEVFQPIAFVSADFFM